MPNVNLSNEDPWELFNNHIPITPKEAYEKLEELVVWYYRNNRGCDQLWVSADVLVKRYQYEKAARGEYTAG